jgi:UDP-N-acetylmuramate--alanine ligase
MMQEKSVHEKVVDTSVGVELQIPGLHNARNATGALCAAILAGVRPSDAVDAISEFIGAARRFDLVSIENDVLVFNDYGHTHTEIATLLDTAHKRYPGVTVRALYQPHLYSRTKMYAKELVRALSIADDVVVCDLYPARENQEDWPGVSSQTIMDEAGRQDLSGRFSYVADMFDAGRAIVRHSKPGDLIITVGCGDIDRADSAILDELREMSAEASSEVSAENVSRE